MQLETEKINAEVIVVVLATLIDQIHLTFMPSELANSLSFIGIAELLPQLFHLCMVLL